MPDLQSNGILADFKSDTSLLTGIPDIHAAQSNSTMRSMTETFDHQIADIAALATTGWTTTQAGSATTELANVTGANGYLLLDAGETASSGVNVQANGTPGLVTAPAVKTIGPITATTTLMDNKELIFKTRLSLAQDTIASGWVSAVVFGWIVTDDALQTIPGEVSINTGGGFGFHIGTNGIINTFSQSTTTGTYSANATDFSLASGGEFEQTTAATFQHWIEFGCRARWFDASAGTGQIDYFINKEKIATVDNGLPMTTNSQTYSVSYQILNGDPSDDIDMAIQSITTGITRTGD